jgi:hypothetical protein
MRFSVIEVTTLIRGSVAICAVAVAVFLISTGSNMDARVGDLAPHSRMASGGSRETGGVTGPRPTPVGIRQLQMSFESTQGLSKANVEFLSRGRGYTLHLTATEAVLSRSGAVVRMSFPGANSEPEVFGLDPVATKSNYITGNDPARWRTGVSHFGRVRYAEIYPGINLEFYGSEGQLEYDFIVAPGGDPEQIRLAFAGPHDLALDERGNLIVSLLPSIDESSDSSIAEGVNAGKLMLRAPIIYQEINGIRVPVEGEFSLGGDAEVAFDVGDHDHRMPLVIDPVLLFSTYLGGAVEDRANDLVVDREGNLFIVGQCESSDFPTKDAYDPGLAGSSDAYIAKLSPDGSTLLFSTFLGGWGYEYGRAIALDSAGNILVTGETRSSDFPTKNAVDGQKTGTQFSEDIFITKLNPTGSALVFSTYLGGYDEDFSGGIATDPVGNVYVAGETWSSDFPTANAWQPAWAGPAMSRDAIVAKLHPSGKPLIYSTHLGGADDEDSASDIDVDASGNAYVTGYTWSTDFPTLAALKPTASFAAGPDAILTRFNPSGVATFSTYFGGDASGEIAYAISVDPVGTTYIVGATSSTDFPTKNAYQGTYAGNSDAFVSKLKSDGSAIIQSTYLGGAEDTEIPFGLAVDRFGNAYLTGRTDSSDFPTVDPLDGERSSDSDAFFSRLSPDGKTLMYSTYLGGAHAFERGFGVATGPRGHVYVAGYTWSSDFPTYSALQPTLLGASNAWIMGWQWPTDFWIAGTTLPTEERAGEDDGGNH